MWVQWVRNEAKTFWELGMELGRVSSWEKAMGFGLITGSFRRPGVVPSS